MKALILCGGGKKGSFQCGVLNNLSKKESLNYDIFCGVSVGAINSSILACGPMEETLPQLESMWLNDIKGNRSIYTHHLWNYILAEIGVIIFFVVLALTSFFIELPKLYTTSFLIFAGLSIYLPYFTLRRADSIYNTEPLKNLITSKLDVNKLANSGKKLRVGSISYEDAVFKVVDEHDPDIISWILASSAFPILFPMISIDKKSYTDIGAFSIEPVSDCISLGAKEIDIILTNPLKVNYTIKKKGIVWQLLRIFDIAATKSLYSDIRTHINGKDIKVRIFSPVNDLGNNILNFDSKEIKKIYELGRDGEYEIHQ